MFPLACAINVFAVNILLIGLGLTGYQVIAAEIGIVQASTFAVLYAFSANARSLILSHRSNISATVFMTVRLVLMAPLVIICYGLSVSIIQMKPLFVCIVILRRYIEWLSEVHLSEIERRGDTSFVRQYILMQFTSLLSIFLWFVCKLPVPLLGLFFWAISPLFFSVYFIKELLVKNQNSLKISIKIIRPNLGSTWVIGITLYVFRLLIVLLVADKLVVGDLFTAFAIGSAIGSIFTHALGASIVFYESNGTPSQWLLMHYILGVVFIFGFLLIIASHCHFFWLRFTSKSYFFWNATGLSIVGGVIMVYAQKIRFYLLQHNIQHDLLKSDILISLLIIVSILLIFDLFGPDALINLYFWNAVLTFIFYFSVVQKIAIFKQV